MICAQVFAPCILLLASLANANAGWQVEKCERLSAPAAAVVHLQTTVRDAESGARATVDFAVFNDRTHTLRVVDQAGEPRRDLAEVMAAGNILAGVNGGYFDPELQPVGLLVAEGRLLAPLRKARLLSGVLAVNRGRVTLKRLAEFSMKSNPSQAVQCGPFLVDGSKPVPGLEATRSARRTAVATARDGSVALLATSSVTLAEVAEILATPGVAAGMKIERALNLDGGSSTAFWFRAAPEAFSISEAKTVRDFVAVVPK